MKRFVLNVALDIPGIAIFMALWMLLTGWGNSDWQFWAMMGGTVFFSAWVKTAQFMASEIVKGE